MQRRRLVRAGQRRLGSNARPHADDKAVVASQPRFRRIRRRRQRCLAAGDRRNHLIRQPPCRAAPPFGDGLLTEIQAEPPKRPNVAALRLLLPFVAPYRWRAVGAGLALLVAAGMMLALGPYLRQLIDNG